ncbi:hypothetical protein GCM10008931_00990 [Oceanobacillus oncorhynchi subsp. oncorhynchi]
MLSDVQDVLVQTLQQDVATLVCLGARSSANFCQEEHLAKVDLQMVLIPQESKRSASANKTFYT